MMSILDRIAKPMFIRILMIIDSVFVACTSYLIIYILKGFRNVSTLEGLRPFYTIFQKSPMFVTILIILSLIIAFLGLYRYFRVKQDTFSLINGLSSLVYIVLFVIERDFFEKILSIKASDDIYALKDLFNLSSTMIFRLLFVLSIVLVLYNIVVLLMAKKIIRANVFVPDHIANSREVKIGDQVYTNTQIMGDSTRMYVNSPKVHFFRTANGLVLMTIIVAVAIAFVGYTAYDQFIVCEAVNIGSNINIKYNKNVDSGDGTLLKSEITNKTLYGVKNKQARIYLKNLAENKDNYTISKSHHLKNNDEVTIALHFDRQRCNDLHIRIVNNTKTIKVNGFIRKFKNGDELSHNKKLLTQIFNEGKMQMNTQKNVYSYTSYRFDSAWLCKYKKGPDAIALIYQTSDDSGTAYKCVYTSQGVKTNYLSEIHAYEGPRPLTNKTTREEVTTSDDARALMKNGIKLPKVTGRSTNYMFAYNNSTTA